MSFASVSFLLFFHKGLFRGLHADRSYKTDPETPPANTCQTVVR